MVLALCLALLSLPTPSVTVISFQVSDSHDHPLAGVILSTKDSSTISAPTDGAGKTELRIPARLQPGSTLLLVLVSAPDRDLQFLAPWEGHGTVPQQPRSIEVVLGKLKDAATDSAVLKNEKVLYALALEISESGERAGAPESDWYVVNSRKLMTIAKTLKLPAASIDSAIRKWAETTDDSEQRRIGSKYTLAMPLGSNP